MKGKYREFLLSFTGGSLSGIAIAYLLGEWKSTLIHSLISAIIITVLFFFGIILTKIFYSKKFLFNYFVNYASGVASSLIVSFFILSKGNIFNQSITVGVGILIYILIAFIVIKTKRKQD